MRFVPDQPSGTAASESLRTVEYEDTFVIKGRGRVYATVEADPIYEVGEHVLINGKEYVIKGIENFLYPRGRQPGDKAGLLVEALP